MSSWIIQDGNYPDFELGPSVEFAVEFWIPDTTGIAVSQESVSADFIAEQRYNAVAQVLIRTSEITVIDVGIVVYGQTNLLPAQLSELDRFSGVVGLGIDPFFYIEGLNSDTDMPPLVYSWRISSILLQTTPFVETGSGDRKVWVRDPQRSGYRHVPKTDAWGDDGGYAEYILECDLLPIAPKRSSATALI